MVNTEPLRKYIESREAMKAGKPDTALTLLADSLGSNIPTPYMKSAIKELTEPNQAILTIILHESKGETRG